MHPFGDGFLRACAFRTNIRAVSLKTCIIDKEISDIISFFFTVYLLNRLIFNVIKSQEHVLMIPVYHQNHLIVVAHEFVIGEGGHFFIKHASFALVKLNEMLVVVAFEMALTEVAYLSFFRGNNPDFIRNFRCIWIIFFKSLHDHLSLKTLPYLMISHFRFLQFRRPKRVIHKGCIMRVIHKGMLHLRMIQFIEGAIQVRAIIMALKRNLA